MPASWLGCWYRADNGGRTSSGVPPRGVSQDGSVAIRTAEMDRAINWALTSLAQPFVFAHFGKTDAGDRVEAASYAARHRLV